MQEGSAPPAAALSTQRVKDHVFVYYYDEVFSYDELQKCDLTDLKTLKIQIARAVNSKLKVREIPDLLNVNMYALQGQAAVDAE